MKQFWLVVLLNVSVLGYQATEALKNAHALSFLLGCGLIYFSTLLNVWIVKIAKKSVAYLVLLVVFKLVLVLGILTALFSAKYLKPKIVSSIITGTEVMGFVLGVVFAILMLSILAKNILADNTKHRA